MSNKEYRLQRLKEGTRFKEASAKEAVSQQKISEAKARESEAKASIPASKARKAEAKALAEKYKAIARKEKRGNIIKRLSKAVKYSAKLSSSLLNYGANIGNQPQGRTQSHPGRPAGVMKWRSPFTGRPIPAPQYYKEVRAFRRIQSQQAEQTQVQQIQQMARKGITPQQVAIIQLRNQQMQTQTQQMPQQYPQQVQQPPSSAVRPIWRRQAFLSSEPDILGNRRNIILGNDPRSFWN